MTLSEALLPEFDQEMALTRRCLERVPDEKFDWKPHPKSGALGWLAGFLAVLPGWTSTTLKQDSLDLSPPGGGPPLPSLTNRRAVLEMFDKNVGEARTALAVAPDPHLLAPWTLLNGGQKLLTLPRIAILRTFVISHLIHHRGQLTVYLRLNDVPVPALYGPSADEGSWG